MKLVTGLATGALTPTLAACVSFGGDPAPVAANDGNATACIQGLRVETNNPTDPIVVLGSDPRAGVVDYTLEIGGTGLWSCEITPDGTLLNLRLLSSDGSPLA